MSDLPNDICVVLPVWNGARFLREALESVLGEKGENLHVVVVDDGSTDESATIARSFGERVRCISRAHQGLAASMNCGIRESKSEFLSFIDSDDLWVPGRLEKMNDLQRKSGKDIVLGLTQLKGTELPPGFRWPVPQSEPVLTMSLGASLIRRSLFDRLGLFDETLIHCGDWDWFLRLREAKVPVAILRETVLRYRRHDGNMTLNVRQGQSDQFRILKNSLDRRKNLASGATPVSLPNLQDPSYGTF